MIRKILQRTLGPGLHLDFAKVTQQRDAAREERDVARRDRDVALSGVETLRRTLTAYKASAAQTERARDEAVRAYAELTEQCEAIDALHETQIVKKDGRIAELERQLAERVKRDVVLGEARLAAAVEHEQTVRGVRDETSWLDTYPYPGTGV